MLEVILHLFILIPIFTYIKHLKKNHSQKFIMAVALFSIVSIVHISYFQKEERKENFYDLMGVSPKGFQQAELKRSYYNLSKVYHPDKNDDPEAADKFVQVKLAYDILSSPEKRNAYDVFRQTDFSQEERILEQLKWQFKNETMRAEQFRLYQISIKSMTIAFQIVPFYLTWLILTIVFIKEDRRTAKFALCIFCIGMGFFEGFTKIKYGDPDYLQRFEKLNMLFPQNNTIGDNLDLLRYMFPLIFQFTILLLDYTIDRLRSGEDEKSYANTYNNIIKKQKELIVQINDYRQSAKNEGKNGQDMRKVDEFRRFYENFMDFLANDSQEILNEIEKETQQEQKFTFVKFIRMLFGIIIMITIFSAFFLGVTPGAPAPDEQTPQQSGHSHKRF